MLPWKHAVSDIDSYFYVVEEKTSTADINDEDVSHIDKNDDGSDDQSRENTGADVQSEETEEKTSTQSGSGWFSAWGVSNITKMVESTVRSFRWCRLLLWPSNDNVQNCLTSISLFFVNFKILLYALALSIILIAFIF